MTEFGRTPYFTAEQFADFGFAMVIWPVTSLRIAAKAIGGLYETLMRDGSAESLLDRMQTRAQLYETIGYNEYEALDQTIAQSAVPPDLRRKP
jgi:methylisocitrate lyase